MDRYPESKDWLDLAIEECERSSASRRDDIVQQRFGDFIINIHARESDQVSDRVWSELIARLDGGGEVFYLKNWLWASQAIPYRSDSTISMNKSVVWNLAKKIVTDARNLYPDLSYAEASTLFGILSKLIILTSACYQEDIFHMEPNYGSYPRITVKSVVLQVDENRLQRFLDFLAKRRNLPDRNDLVAKNDALRKEVECLRARLMRQGG